MSSNQNEERIEPSRDQRKSVIRRSIGLWRSLSEATRLDKQLPLVSGFALGFRQVPSFTKTLHRPHTTGNKELLFAKGSATWSTTDKSGCLARESLGKSDCNPIFENDYSRLPETKSFEQSFLLGIQDSTSCNIDPNHKFRKWPGEKGDLEDGSNYVAALTLAWAYIISSIWAESQGGKVIYTDKSAPIFPQGTMDSESIVACDSAATRWWAAVLAPRRGWTATITVDDVEYQSPWSIRLDSKPMFTVIGPTVSYNVERPGSYQSFTYLLDFCHRYNLLNQGKAALGSVLAFPSHAHLQVPLTLPPPNHIRSNTYKTEVPQPLMQILEDSFQVLPNLMTLSSAVTGLSSVLCSVFFEPSIPCNLCSEWLEPLFTIVSSALDARHLTAMCVLRSPSIGAWWLGGMVTGLCNHVIKEARSGTPFVNLPSWWWTRLPQSYVCCPCTDFIDETGTMISRQKEAILLYLSQETWSYTPPWRPPGRTNIEDAHIVVREHARCTGHNLSYQSWSWIWKDGFSVFDRGYSTQHSLPAIYDNPIYFENQEAIDLEAMSQDASKSCSRMILWGLGQQGIAARDRTLYQSLEEWVGLAPDDSDESGLESGDSDNKTKDAGTIQDWLSNIKQVI